LSDEWWYPVYEKLVALDASAMIHASATCNPAFHTTGSHYLNADSTAFMQLMESRVFKDFPTLRIIISHGGGTIPYQAARYRALCLLNKWEPFEEFIKRLYFDTTVYSPEAMELLVKVVGIDNVIFASEMLGGVTAVDPQSGRYFDDNKPCLDRIPWLTEQDHKKIFEENAKKAYPCLGPVLERRRGAHR
jgi:4-oxalmesaconate hydratase